MQKRLHPTKGRRRLALRGTTLILDHYTWSNSSTHSTTTHRRQIIIAFPLTWADFVQIYSRTVFLILDKVDNVRFRLTAQEGFLAG